jgi:hypothetical protein
VNVVQIVFIAAAIGSLACFGLAGLMFLRAGRDESFSSDAHIRTMLALTKWGFGIVVAGALLAFLLNVLGR